MESKKYVDFDKVITIYKTFGYLNLHNVLEAFNEIPAADVLPRDEAIKMGAELAAMHGSDAASQQLEEAYLKGVEYGMTRRDVRPVVRDEWVAEKEDVEWGCSTVRYRCSHCGRLPHFDKESFKFLLSDFCPKCGADMREIINE